MSKCDCENCGGERDCGCGHEAAPSAGASCSSGACSITSQSTAMGRSSSTVHPAAARAFRGMRIAGYENPQMKVGGPVVRENDPSIAGYGGPIVPPAGQALVLSAGQALILSAGQTPPAPPLGQSKQGDAWVPPQQQVGIPPEVAQGLMNIGTVGLQGLTSIITTAFTQSNETERARIAADAQQRIAQLQRQGLLSQQEANDAAMAVMNARASAPPVALQPVGWWASLTPNTKMAVGVGAAAGVVGIGALIYKYTR